MQYATQDENKWRQKMVATRKKKQRGLTPSTTKETSTIKISIDSSILSEAKEYAEFIGITSIDETIEQALRYVISDDPNWKTSSKKKTA